MVSESADRRDTLNSTVGAGPSRTEQIVSYPGRGVLAHNPGVSRCQKRRDSLRSKLAALFASILVFTRVLAAQSRGPQHSQEQVTVAGHLDLQGIPVKQILQQQQRGEKGYLFLRRADKNAFAIVDVTNAAVQRTNPLQAYRVVHSVLGHRFVPCERHRWRCS